MLNYVSSRWFPVNQTIKTNILDVVNLTFNFQTSINYPIQTPPPFAQDVHVDIAAELTRIRAQTYASEFDFHVDLSRTIKRLQDGHTVYIDLCFDSLFLTFISFLVVLLNDDAQQAGSIYILPQKHSRSLPRNLLMKSGFGRAQPISISVK